MLSRVESVRPCGLLGVYGEVWSGWVVCSGLEAKRLSYLTAALTEMASRAPGEEYSPNLLEELEGLLPHPSRQVYRYSAKSAP